MKERYWVRGGDSWIAISSSLLLMVCASTAWGDDSPSTEPAGAGALEEVTVTALRFQEKLQDAPAAISVINADTLESTEVRTLNDITPLVPNFSILQSWRPGVAAITMRGIPTVQGGEAPVAILIDGVQLPALDFFSQDLLDIQDIQVIRGPQGALYGRGAIAGAVLIDTRQPGDTYYSKVKMSYGRGDDARVWGTASGPIVPGKLLFKATVSERYFGGLDYNVGLNRGADSARNLVGQAQLVWKPDDLTTVDLRAEHQVGTFGQSATVIVTTPEIPDFNLHPDTNLPNYDNRTLDQDSLKIDRDTPIGTITSISQWAHVQNISYNDADFSPEPVAQAFEYQHISAFNQDLRITSVGNGNLRWIFGGFFQHRVNPDLLLVLAQPDGVLPPGLVLDRSDDRQISTSWAVYGQANYKLPYDFELMGALRFDSDHRQDEDKDVLGSQIDATFAALQPSATLSKRLNKSILLYLTYGRGFRSGGFNPYVDVQNSLGTSLPAVRKYPKETSDNYEIGFKTQFPDNRLTLNGAAYHTDFANQQFYFTNITPPSRDIVTFPKTAINGGELELTFDPIPRLALSSEVGINDAHITDAGAGIMSKYDGNRSPLSYDYTFDLGAQYTIPLGGAYALTSRVDYQRLGNIYYDQTGLVSYHPVNYVSARIELDAEKWSLAVFGRNLTDTRAPTLVSPNAFGQGIDGRYDNDPISWGVEATATF